MENIKTIFSEIDKIIEDIDNLNKEYGIEKSLYPYLTRNDLTDLENYLAAKQNYALYSNDNKLRFDLYKLVIDKNVTFKKYDAHSVEEILTKALDLDNDATYGHDTDMQKLVSDIRTNLTNINRLKKYLNNNILKVNQILTKNGKGGDDIEEVYYELLKSFRKRIDKIRKAEDNDAFMTKRTALVEKLAELGIKLKGVNIKDDENLRKAMLEFKTIPKDLESFFAEYRKLRNFVNNYKSSGTNYTLIIVIAVISFLILLFIAIVWVIGVIFVLYTLRRSNFSWQKKTLFALGSWASLIWIH